MTSAYDFGTFAYENKSFSVQTEEGSAIDVYFKPDGTKMYIIGYSGDEINEYNLSTAWDVSTASASQVFSISSQSTTPRGFYFKPDGTKFYTTGSTGDDVDEYNMSTAWDISTASYVQNFSVATQDNSPFAVHFSKDGTKMFVLGGAGSDILVYALSTAWDISTASYEENKVISGTVPSPTTIFFDPDGGRLFAAGFNEDKIAHFVVGGLDISSEEIAAGGIDFKPDGTKMYIVGRSGDDVSEYNLSTAWDLSTASYSQNFSILADESAVEGVRFKPDGTKMFIIGYSGDEVNQYDLSTAWDISTASESGNKSVAALETSPRGLYFKDDGTKMYITGNASDKVHQWALSTAWDVTTASVDTNFSVSTQDGAPYDVFFNEDGTKMFVLGNGNDNILEYDLSTAWNVSTSTYSQSLYVRAEEQSPYGFYFKPDGTGMFLIGGTGKRVIPYTLGPQ